MNKITVFMNGTVVTQDAARPLIEDGAVVVQGDEIIACGTTEAIQTQYDLAAAYRVDAKGGLIMPGFMNTHNHIYSAMARGMHVFIPPKADLLTILKQLWWKMDASLTNELTYQSARMVYLECIKNGVTSMIDHHASYGEIQDSLSAIAAAAQEFQVKSCLGYEVSDRMGISAAHEAVLENERFINEAKQSDILEGMMGLHASFTLSDATLEFAAAHANGAGFHVHVAEGSIDETDCMEIYHMPIIKRFQHWGLLGKKSLMAHCIHINTEEMKILAQTHTPTVFNPESNMNNAAGYPPVLSMMQQGITVGLGTDAYTQDMMESFKAAVLLNKHALQDTTAGYTEVPQMLFVNNRDIMNRHFARPTGIIKAHAAADIIVVDYHAPTPLQKENLYDHILFGIQGHDVISTMANGKLVMENRELHGIDEEKIIADCRKGSETLWRTLA